MSDCTACGRRATTFLCPKCIDDLRVMLRKLPGWLAHLAESATGQTRLGGDGGRRANNGPRMLHGDDSALAKCTCRHHANAHQFREDPDDQTSDPGYRECNEPDCGCLEYDGVPNPAALQRSLLATGRVNARASQLQLVIRNSLTTIVRDICETRSLTVLWDQGVTAPTRLVVAGIADGWLNTYPPLNGPTSANLARWLAQHVDAIAADESAGLWFREIEGHVKAIEKLIDRPALPKFCGPCPSQHVCRARCDIACRRREQRCNTLLLAKNGAIEVTCPDCRNTHNIERITRDLDLRAANMRFTAPEILLMMQLSETPIPERTWSRWRKEGRVKVRGYKRPDRDDGTRGSIGLTRRSDDDEPVYRLGEVRKVWERSIRHTDALTSRKTSV